MCVIHRKSKLFNNLSTIIWYIVSLIGVRETCFFVCEVPKFRMVPDLYYIHLAVTDITAFTLKWIVVCKKFCNWLNTANKSAACHVFILW